VAPPVGALPIPMIESALQTPLVAAVGIAALLAPNFGAASRAAIALPAVAVRANPECRLASPAATNARTENHFFMNRHRKEGGASKSARNTQSVMSLKEPQQLRLTQRRVGHSTHPSVNR
jgi:hypothetical protein